MQFLVPLLQKFKVVLPGGATNSFDPDLEMPTHKKLSIGMKRQIGEYDVTLDYMWSRNKNPFYVYNLANTVSGLTNTGHVTFSNTVETGIII